MRREWCDSRPEELGDGARPRFKRLHDFLRSGKIEIRVLPDDAFGLIHGKAGVITRADGRRTSFLGSANETRAAFHLNYELVWEDDSPEAVAWVQEEFDALWSSPFAVRLSDFVVQDLDRLSRREPIGDVAGWREEPDPDPASVDRRSAGLPQGSGLVEAPEALRQARLRCASRAARRALRAGRSGGAREDAAIGDGGAAHGPGRRRAGAHPGSEAPSPAVAGRDGHPARAAVGALERPRLGGRARDRAPGRRRRIDPALPAPGRDRLHRPRHRQRRGRQMVGGDALRVRHPRRGAPGAAPEPVVRPPGVRARTAQQPPEVPPGDLAPHQEPAARDRHPGPAPSRGGIRSPRRPRPGLARGARRPRQPLAQRRGIPRSAARQRAPAHRFPRALGLAAQPLPSPLRREGLRDPAPLALPAGRGRVCAGEQGRWVAPAGSAADRGRFQTASSSATTPTSAPSSCAPASISRAPSTPRRASRC